MFEELGISAGTAIIVLFALYFVIKWGVKNGIRDYYLEKEQKAAMEKQLTETHKEEEDAA